MIEEGDTAPEFALRGYHDGETTTHRLSDYTDAGDWVLVQFYAFDFNPVCTAGACSLRDSEFLQFEDDLQVLGVSGDSVYAHEAFAEEHAINYPLLSDTDRAVGRAYDAVQAALEGMSDVHERSIFLVDPDGTVRLAVETRVDDPNDVRLSPLLDRIRAVRGQ